MEKERNFLDFQKQYRGKMKNELARNNSGDDWKTPDSFYNILDKVFHFDFDPCPYQSDFDGLKSVWGGRTSLTHHIQEN